MFFGRSPRRPRRKKRRSLRPYRLQLEALETRLAPATLTVLNTNDSGAGSLRQAILDANAAPGDSAITFADGVTGAIDLHTALPDLTGNIDLEGPGADKLTVERSQDSGTPYFRIFSVSGGATVTFSGLTVTKGFPSSSETQVNGGGILNYSGTVSVVGCVVTANNANVTYQGGGGIANFGTMTVSNTTISANNGGWIGGGGIYNLGVLTILGSSITNNVAGHNGRLGGGGIASYGPLTISDSSITGNTDDSTGGGIFDYDDSITIENSTIAKNVAGDSGGGVEELFGTLTLDNSVVSANSTTYQGGGVDTTAGRLVIKRSQISQNLAAYDGGGIYGGGFLLEVTQSTIRDNSASRSGGGIAVAGYGGSVTDSTISGNSAGGPGGGISNDTGGYILWLSNSTVSSNVSNSGGGVYSSGSSRAIIQNATIALNTVVSDSPIGGQGGGIETVGALDLGNSIVAENSASVAPDVGADLSRTTGLSSFGLSSIGYNFIGDGGGATGFARTDLVGSSVNPINPELGPLQDNGGPTFTEALLSGSPAIDTGDNTEPNLPSYDQRGNPFARISGRALDIGAFEVQQPPSADLALSVSASPASPILGQQVTYTLTLLNNGPDPASNVQLADTLPARVLFVSATTTQGTFTRTSDNLLSFQLGALAVGKAVTMTFVLAPTAAGNVVNTATATGTEADPISANNTVRSATVIGLPPSADLALLSTTVDVQEIAGENFPLTFIARNNGPDRATNVQLVDDLPAGTTFLRAAASQGSWTKTGSTLIFHLGALAVGSDATISLVLVSSQTGTITNVATLSATETDPAPTNNTVQQTLPINPPPDAETLFVTALYGNVLRRAPDTAGLRSWLASLDNGTPRSVVIQAFLESPEHRGLQVDGLYGTYLHRAADPAGRAMWVQALMLGMSETDATRQFLLSQEYESTRPTAADFVNGLYADLFLRAGDPGGTTLWQGLLAAGVSRDSVVQAFLNSDEAYIHTVDRYYYTYLHNIPSAAAVNAWVTQLQSHFIGTDQLAEALLLSGL